MLYFSKFHKMRYLNLYKLLLVVGVATLFASCASTKNSLREPKAYVALQKYDFDFSEQVVAEASSKKLFGITILGKANKVTDEEGQYVGKLRTANLPVCGNVVTTKEESRALAKLLEANPEYDVIFYPQYELDVKKVLGVFQKRNIKATARLGKLNDIVFTADAEEMVSDIMQDDGELVESYNALQDAYDALVVELSSERSTYMQKQEEMKKQLDDAEASVTVLPSATTPVRASVVTPVATPSQPVATQPQPVQSVQPVQVSQGGAYNLILGSFSSMANATRYISEFMRDYSTLGKIYVIQSGAKFRVGFVNFQTRPEADEFKRTLIKSYPEFNDIWVL
jgi:hypothetical protein